jgi:cyclopropane-fatty-acyl-phospholipid synthase
MWQQAVIRTFLKTLEHVKYGSVSIVLPDGKQYDFAGPKAGSQAILRLHNWRTLSLFAAHGDIGLAEAYRDGWWDSDDLVALMQFGLENEQALEPYLYGSWIGQFMARIAYYGHINTLRGSRRNIHAHYDLGNEFFALWLDAGMSYSAALYDSPYLALEVAQTRKYGRIIDRLDANSGNLLEIGCGWGGFAEQALASGDYAIKGITLSHEQQRYACTRLGSNANIALEDYRIQQGRYQHIVSIEMFEAVGEKYWLTYFSKLKTLLAERGKAMVQTITIGDPYFERYRKGGDMIRSFIFPGGMLPSFPRFDEHARRAGLRVTDSFAFGGDYALTLRAWLQRFEEQLPAIRALGFDDAFIRIWRFYLASCIASFAIGRTDVMQLELQHA